MNKTAFLLAIGLSLGALLSGCQSASNPKEEKKDQGAVAAVSQKAETPAPKQGFTQEEAGIKIRVDMPEIKKFLESAKPGPIIPALKQNAVPQGIAYIEEKNWLLVSHYREDGKPSLISVVDAASGQMVKAMELYKDANTPYMGHAGGLTASKKFIWVSSDSFAYRIPIEDVVKAENNSRLQFAGSIKTETRASFDTYANGVLWIGEFADGKDYPTDKTHYMNNRDDKQHKGWAVGYKLDPNTDLPAEGKSASSSAPLVPDYILSIPDKIQGMAVVGDSVILSNSSGRNAASELQTYAFNLADKPHATAEIGADKAQVPLWFLDGKNRTEKLDSPPMTEGIVDVKGVLNILFESGATAYRASSSYALDRIYTLPLKK